MSIYKQRRSEMRLRALYLNLWSSIAKDLETGKWAFLYHDGYGQEIGVIDLED